MAPKKQDKSQHGKVVAENRKARFNYEIVDTFEAGLVLTGTEVKSLREGKANIAESYANEEGGEMWLINSYVPEYLQANRSITRPAADARSCSRRAKSRGSGRRFSVTG
jgi:SsrA-binding protein